MTQIKIKIWYTTGTKPVGNAYGAEVMRHWSHPQSSGVKPVWARLYTTREEAEEEAQRECGYALMEQMQRDALCCEMEQGN